MALRLLTLHHRELCVIACAGVRVRAWKIAAVKDEDTLCMRYGHKDVNDSLLRLLTRPRLMEATSSGYFAIRKQDQDLTRLIDKLEFSSAVTRGMWHPSYDCVAIVTTQEVLRGSHVVLVGLCHQVQHSTGVFPSIYLIHKIIFFTIVRCYCARNK